MSQQALVAKVAATATRASSSEETTVDVACSESGQLCEVLYEWTDNELVAETTSFIPRVPIKIAVIVALAVVMNWLIRRSISRLTERLATVTVAHGEAIVDERTVDRATERAATIGSLLRSVTTAIVFSAATIMVLETFGIGVVAVIASAGVLSLAIGFGAQSVVEDLLRGTFMLAEDQFGVGDRIDVGFVNGYVERVTLRTTVVRDSQGSVWHIPNSEISWVSNENQTHSRATIVIGVSYAADLDEALTVLADAAQDAAEEPAWRDRVDGEPTVQGIHELGDDAVMIRVITWVEASERRGYERHLRRRLKDALDRADIEMPNRQIDVWQRQPATA